MAGYGAQSKTVYSGYDRSDAAVHYGGLFSEHRAGSLVYGGWGEREAYAAPDQDAHLPDRRPENSAAKTAAKNYTRQTAPHITTSEKGIMIFVAVFVAAILIGVIALEAYSVSIQHGINKTEAESASLQKEIDELYVAIEKGSNIATIEDTAAKDLKMVYPETEQIRYGAETGAENGDVDIAEDIRDRAYGT